MSDAPSDIGTPITEEQFSAKLEAECDALVRLSQSYTPPRYQAWDIFGGGWYDITKEDYDLCKNHRDKAVRIVEGTGTTEDDK